MTDKEKLLKTMNLLTQVMGNYQTAAEIADNEGYETNFDQDDILVNYLKSEVSE